MISELLVEALKRENPNNTVFADFENEEEIKEHIKTLDGINIIVDFDSKELELHEAENSFIVEMEESLWDQYLAARILEKLYDTVNTSDDPDFFNLISEVYYNYIYKEIALTSSFIYELCTKAKTKIQLHFFISNVKNSYLKRNVGKYFSFLPKKHDLCYPKKPVIFCYSHGNFSNLLDFYKTANGQRQLEEPSDLGIRKSLKI